MKMLWLTPLIREVVMYIIMNYLFVDKLYKIIGEVLILFDNININNFYDYFDFV